ncbi:MAG: hypothetical protein EXS16_20965 [Gemmataceae bacterium]|nr:hypothetical protein [Gemmataceae bacterium]
MSGPAVIIKELHRLRLHVVDLSEKIAFAPKQKAVQEKKLGQAEETLTKAKESIARLTLDMRDKENSVRATQQQIKKYEKQLDESANKKEYETLKSELATSKGHVAKLEDEILADMGTSEEKTAQLPSVEQATKKARDDFAQWQIDFQERLARFAAEKTRAQDELKAVEATLPVEVRQQYDRFIAAKGNDCLAGVKGKICAECYTEVTTQMIADLRREAFVICKNCGRMLYIAT